MSNIDPRDISEYVHDAGDARALKAWARSGGILFALATALSMAYSAEWEFGMMVFDPLVWMMLLMALAAGLVCGYAVGVRLVSRAARIR
ncbi:MULTISPECIES: hypothetical protein [Dyella]|uniref:hypothetical protein n=1 Tax=Dyella TaxID=231454 RepID=UPI001EFC7A03|nr:MULTISPECIES: hypothetical protein [Dyella]MDR3447426.1 hypothetical protein [Dyella sp.]ULU25812.1 hypothetical protein DYST_02749 [Dyella terrae]